VLHLDGQLAPVMAARHVHLRQRRAGDGLRVEGGEELLRGRSEILLDDGCDLSVGFLRGVGSVVSAVVAVAPLL